MRAKQHSTVITRKTKMTLDRLQDSKKEIQCPAIGSGCKEMRRGSALQSPRFLGYGLWIPGMGYGLRIQSQLSTRNPQLEMRCAPRGVAVPVPKPRPRLAGNFLDLHPLFHHSRLRAFASSSLLYETPERSDRKLLLSVPAFCVKNIGGAHLPEAPILKGSWGILRKSDLSKSQSIISASSRPAPFKAAILKSLLLTLDPFRLTPRRSA